MYVTGWDLEKGFIFVRLDVYKSRTLTNSCVNIVFNAHCFFRGMGDRGLSCGVVCVM